MEIKIILIFYLIFAAFVSLFSFRKGFYLVWVSFMFIPTIILEQKLLLQAETILMLTSVVSELNNKDRRVVWFKFINDNLKAVILFLFASLLIVLLSETVPIENQIIRIVDESTMLLFSFQTFMFARDVQNAAKTLLWIVCVMIVFNMVYCLFFEVYLGLNPAGLPLYIVMGIDDNEFIVDMIETERGELSLRAQTIYRHPLSLGQYLLAIMPIFLLKSKIPLKLLSVIFICCLVVLSGSRGALFPLVLILILSIKRFVNRSMPWLLLPIVFAISYIPDKTWKDLGEKVEPFVASLQFWDDEKQKDNDIKGSSMEMRLNQFDAAVREISDNPIFGKGYGYREYYIFKHHALHPELLGFESILLLYLVERGWFGLIFFFMMMAFLYRLFWRATSDRMIILYVFLGFMLSIVMTGIRPLSLLFVCLACSITCGMAPRLSSKPV